LKILRSVGDRESDGDRESEKRWREYVGVGGKGKAGDREYVGGEYVGVGVCGEREGSRVQREKLKAEMLKS
jgi:hypothetical protein